MSAVIDPRGITAGTLSTMFKVLGAKVGEVNRLNGWDTSRQMVDSPDAFDPRHVVAHKIAELGLITTEVAEAIEEVRHGHPMTETYYKTGPDDDPTKPEGVPSELADSFIRILDLCDAYDIDLAAAFVEKLNHNATRGTHHGGKAI